MGEGKYSDKGDKNCTFCPAATFNDKDDSDASDHHAEGSCTACAAGELSNALRTKCETCTAGQFVKDNECDNCTKGKYAPQPLSGACLPCKAGAHTGVPIAAKTCTSCDAGEYSARESVTCLTCRRGSYSTPRSAECSNCSLGTFSSDDGSSSCTPCAAGRHAALQGATSCVDCAVGFNQVASGQESCTSCVPGRYTASTGSTICSAWYVTMWLLVAPLASPLPTLSLCFSWLLLCLGGTHRCASIARRSLARLSHVACRCVPCLTVAC